MHHVPEIVLYHRRPRPRVSIILIDWGVRESFHSLHYLNQQTAPRDEYELIWVEFYPHKPAALDEMARRSNGATTYLDKWLVMGYPTDHVFHKHRLYNVGLLAAEGDICVICDSDAVFAPTFVESLLAAFAETPRAVIHLDEVRNISPRYYPFNYPGLDDILGDGCINWSGSTTVGLDNSDDMIHHANYGACMAARRRDLLAVGGADEHLDYLGYICGPYDLTFRLVNYGRRERWLRNEYLYHTWHPNQSGYNTDYQGPHDGVWMSLRALHARATFRVDPYLNNPWLSGLGRNPRLSADQLHRLLERPPEPGWHRASLPPVPNQTVYLIERDRHGWDVFYFEGQWYALPHGEGPLDPARLRAGTHPVIWGAPHQVNLHPLLPIDPEAEARRTRQRTLPGRLWHKLRAQPLHRLPSRLMRTARALFA